MLPFPSLPPHRDGKHAEAARILSAELQNFPRSRAALSLLGYCYYQMQDFRNAALTYEQLVKFHADDDRYRVYYAQSLYKAGLYPEASKAASTIDSEQHEQRVLYLKAAVAYEEDDLATCKALVDQMLPDEPDTMVNQACILYKESAFEEARLKFVEAISVLGYSSELMYNVALCYYCTQSYGPSLKHIAEIIEKGVREHPVRRHAAAVVCWSVVVRWFGRPALFVLLLFFFFCIHVNPVPTPARLPSSPARNCLLAPTPTASRSAASATPKFCAKRRWWRPSTSKPPSSSTSKTWTPPKRRCPTCRRGLKTSWTQ